MTKQEFLNGVSFTIGTPKHKGESTYKYDGKCILRELRSSIDNRVVISDYECNILKIGSKGFSGFTYVLGKKVNIKYKFEELVEYKEVVGE